MFSCGLAPARIGLGERAAYGYISRSGEVVVPPFADLAWPFKEGVAVFERDGLRGVIDTAGKILVPPQFKSIRHNMFSGGLAVTGVDEKTGYIDPVGAFVIEPQFAGAEPFSEGVAWVGLGDGRGMTLINRSGEALFDRPVDGRSPCSEGLIKVLLKEEQRLAFVDTQGNIVIDRVEGRTFDYAPGDFHEGLACFSDPWKKHGYINRLGQVVIKPAYRYAEDFSEGLAAVCTSWEQGYGYIDQRGQLVIPYRFREPRPFTGGTAVVGVDAVDFGEPTLLYGYIDARGEWALPPCFDSAEPFHEGCAQVRIGTRDESFGGYIDAAGRFIWPAHVAGKSVHEFQPSSTLLAE